MKESTQAMPQKSHSAQTAERNRRGTMTIEKATQEEVVWIVSFLQSHGVVWDCDWQHLCASPALKQTHTLRCFYSTRQDDPHYSAIQPLEAARRKIESIIASEEFKRQFNAQSKEFKLSGLKIGLLSWKH